MSSPRKHGMCNTRVYNIWAMMLQRCTNPKTANYVNYGGAGITVSVPWRDFSVFYADMGHPPTLKHTLDRIDNSLGYSRDNCRWADVETQQNNRTNGVPITAFGETLSAPQWARRTGLTVDMIRHRIFSMGMCPEQAIQAPRMSHNTQRISRSNLDGSDVREYTSLADAARSVSLENYETVKKAIWYALKRGSKSSQGFCWAYASPVQPE